jgi:23S rRNA (uracil1939-C5)-methyltransferase
MSERFELRVDSIAAGGDGVGRHDAMVVFVPRTAPGDVAEVEARLEGRLMRGRVLELRTPSSQRVEPTCGHYVADACGGCQLQHMDYDAQLTAKSGIIGDSLTRIGRLSVEPPRVEPSAKRWRYRRKLTLALRRQHGTWLAGLHRWDAPGAVFALKDCEITDDSVMRFWRVVLEQGTLLPPERELRVAVRLLAAGFALTVQGAIAWKAHEQLFAAIPEMLELWWEPHGQRRRLLHSRETNAAGASFTQVNEGVAASLIAHVVQLAGKAAHATAIDAYAGTGDIAAALAMAGSRVTAIEIDRDASKVCGARLPAGSKVLNAPVERALRDALPADLVVVNPPRAGLAPDVIETLQNPRNQQPAPKYLIYVSCNPATLARDLKRLDRYKVTSVLGFDMFPQTAHVETVVGLELAA